MYVCFYMWFALYMAWVKLSTCRCVLRSRGSWAQVFGIWFSPRPRIRKSGFRV